MLKKNVQDSRPFSREVSGSPAATDILDDPDDWWHVYLELYERREPR